MDGGGSEPHARARHYQRVMLFGFVVLFVLAQLVTAFGPGQGMPPQPVLRTGR